MVGPRRLARVLRRTFRRPADVWLTLRIGWFVWRAPSDLAGRDLPSFLHRLRRARRPTAPDPASAYERVARLRQPWLRLPGWRDRNTCYVRALTLYRFLDPGEGDIELHLAVEDGYDAGDRLHGHAWVSVDSVTFEDRPTTTRRLLPVALDPR